MILTIFLAALVLLFVIGVPAAFALGLTTLIVTVYERGFDNVPYTIIAQRMVYGVNSFPLLAIPFFILAGKIMNSGGITDRIYLFAHRLVGHLRGGLGQVNIACIDDLLRHVRFGRRRCPRDRPGRNPRHAPGGLSGRLSRSA
jgi:TRAP-type mannitol/chloroaromatic compound transport system permease large subunit